MKRLVWSCVPIALAVMVAGCGSSADDSSNSAATTTRGGGKVTVLMGTAPDFLDPQEGYTTQPAEATWISYLGLYTHTRTRTAGRAVR